MMTQNEKDNLEHVIDAHGLYNVLEAISEICRAKAEHIRTNWQDHGLAQAWEYVAKAQDIACHKAGQFNL